MARTAPWCRRRKLIAFAIALSATTLPAVPASAHELPPGDICEDGPFGLPGLTLFADQIGEWGPVQSWPKQATHSSLLSSEKVLWWRNTLNGAGGFLWDPISNLQEVVFGASADLFCGGHATLVDGSLLGVGGQLASGCCFDGEDDTNLFDPVSETWTSLSSMAYRRWYPTATTLPDGRVLAVSGTSDRDDGSGQKVWADIPEIYDPQTDAWTSLPGAGLRLPVYPFNFVLPNGDVVAAGPRSATYVLDIAAQTWTQVATANFDDEPDDIGGSSSAAMYRPGWVLKVGGQAPSIPGAEIVDLTAASPVWRIVSPMAFPRRRLDLVLLPDGTVLAVGGSVSSQSSPECAVHAAELWDPATETWTPLASMQRPRIYHSTSLLLPDGRVLAAGGENRHLSEGEATAEVFSPPYLFKGPRPVIQKAPASLTYGEIISVFTPDPDAIASVALIRPGSVTHNFDQNQRYVPLEFDPKRKHVSVIGPAGPNLAPPGEYMLFLVDTAGVPSVANFLLLAGSTCVANDDPEVGCADSDSDGLTDAREAAIGTDHTNPDSDADGLEDGEEIEIYGTDPLEADTDGDGFTDGDEVGAGTDPLDGSSPKLPALGPLGTGILGLAIVLGVRLVQGRSRLRSGELR